MTRQSDMPVADLTHLTHRPDLEKAVDFSPVAIGIYLLMLAGFALAEQAE